MSFLKWEPIRYDQGLKYIPDVNQCMNERINILTDAIKQNRDVYNSAKGTIDHLTVLWDQTALYKYNGDMLYSQVQQYNLLLSLCKNMKELKV